MQLNGLFDFIKSSPNAYFAVWNMARAFEAAGYRRLKESEAWELSAGKYYVTRDDSSLIAFVIPEKEFKGFRIIASHSDSPSFKIKPNPEKKAGGDCVVLNVEKYGGMILSTWFDRPLSVAGRILLDTEEGVETKLVNIDRDLLMIPSLAIHMDRAANDGRKIEVQKELLPLYSGDGGKGESLLSLVAKEAGVAEKDILDTDLFLYNRQEPTSYGADGEFIAAPRLDDLQCVYASMEGLLAAEPGDMIAMHAVFNNEEVGSETKQGAASSFLSDVMERICEKFGAGKEELIRKRAASFMISADNAHACHPNYPEKADPTSRPVLNGGVVIKYNANQRYTTDGVSAAIFRKLCRKAGVPVQEYVNHSDIAGGSTLGSIATTRVSMNTVDVGLPQLAMHSAYETAGAEDTAAMIRMAEEFFNE